MTNSIEYKVESPTRIDFAGGTLDCWPINALLSPVSTINVAISTYTRASLMPRDDRQIIIHTKDYNQTYSFENIHHLLNDERPEIRFFREHVAFWEPEQGFKLTTESESPLGGGLGGSSSLSVSIFKSFGKWMEKSYELAESVRACAGIEAKILKTLTGTQDYIAAFNGGLNIIDYKNGEPSVEVKSSANLPFSEHICVFYTGKSHQSGINNWQVIKNFVDGDPLTWEALQELKAVADEVKKAIKGESWDRLPALFKAEYNARIKLAESFSSAEIEKLTQVATQNGGEAVKICGAGGGGCVFVWVDPSKKQNLIDACAAEGFQYMDVRFV